MVVAMIETRTLYLDGDGVVAHFDDLAERIFGMPSQAFEDEHGEEEFWARLEAHENFFGSLPLMPDAMELYEGVKHLDPVFLSGIRDDWCTPQKQGWFSRHFPENRLITCKSKDKFMHMKAPGDVLVDDFLKHRHVWIGNGGVFVHHTSAKTSLQRLAELGFDVKIAA